MAPIAPGSPLAAASSAADRICGKSDVVCRALVAISSRDSLYRFRELDDKEAGAAGAHRA
jgi:hypothetical protein